MPDLSVGALFATVELTTVAFDRGFARIVKSLRQLDIEFDRAGESSAALDDGMTSAGRSASTAAVGMDRVTKSTVAAGNAAKDSAVAFIAASDATARERTAQLGLIAAQEKLTRVLADGAATTEQYARAQSSVVAAEERVAAAQRAAADSTGRAALAQRDATAASNGLSEGLAGTIKMAGELGLVFGAFELVKKAIDITKQANDYQRSMVQIQNLTGATKAQVAALSSTLLNMAGKVAQSPEALGTSAYHAESALRKLGATGPEIYKTIETAAKGARIGNADLEDTTNSLTATMASGIVSYKQAGKAMGDLLSIVGTGDMSFQDLNGALSTGLLVNMKTFGVSLKDTGAALAVFGDNNIRGAKAGTQLTMAVRDLAKPAADADGVLSRINLTSAQLRESLAEHGLSGTLTLLKARLTAAGITGKQIGPYLEDAFTKKAGTGLAILLTRLNQFNEAGAQGQKSADTFGKQWQNVTKTASYALSSLGNEAIAAGIRIARGATPAVADLSHGLAVLLPQAVDIAVSAAKPFIATWHTAADVLGPVAHVLKDVAEDAHPIGPVLKVAASGALALYAAMKLIAIGKAIFTALNYGAGAMVGSLFRAEIRMKALGVATQEVATGARSASLGAEAGIIAGIGIAAYGAGKGIASMTEKNNTWAHSLDTSAGTYTSFTTALVNNKGAIDENVKSAVQAQIQQTGLADGAARSGISIAQLTAAVTGGIGPTAKLINQWKASGNASGTNIAALMQMSTEFGQAREKTLAMADAQGKAATQSRTFTVAVGTSGNAAKAEALTVAQLDTALQNLAQTELAAAQSQDSFKEGILALTKTIHSNHDELNQSTQAGLANRDALLGMLGQAVSLAQAQRKNGASIDSVTSSLIKNVGQLKATAEAAGLSSGQVNRLVRSMGLTPKDIRTKFDLTGASTAESALAAILTKMRVIGQGVTASVNVTTHYSGGRTNTVKATAAGSAAVYRRPDGTIPPNTVATVGEGAGHTWEGLITDSAGRARVFSNRQSKAMGFPTPTAYAAGTGATNVVINDRFNLPADVHRVTVGGQKEYRYKGEDYDSLAAVENAIARTAKETAKAAREQAKEQAKAASEAAKAWRTLGAGVADVYRVVNGHLRGKVESTSDIRTGLQDVMKDLRGAGVPRTFLKQLATESGAVIAAAKNRNKAAAALAAANAALAGARKAKSADAASFKAATVGSFDITTAGQDANGRVTAGSLEAAQDQDVARVKLFVSDIDKLAEMKIFPAAYLRELAGKGPDALPTVEALLSMPKGQLAHFAKEERELRQLGAQEGRTVSSRLDDPTIKRDRERERRAEARARAAQKELLHEMRGWRRDIDHELHNLHMKLDWKTGDLTRATKTDAARASHRGRTTP